MLTDAAVKGAKPREKAYKLHDSGGLYLLVQPRGGRYWRMDYRFEGRRKTLALGVYDRVGLKDARGKRDAARAMLDAGTDPSHAKKLSKIAQRAAADDTFGAIADEYLEKLEREGRSPATMGKKRWLLEFAKSGFGNRPISKIEAPELLDVLRKIEGRGHYETARRVRANCGEVFRYGIATGRARRDVAADLRGALIAPTVKHHAAITEPKEIGQLLRAIDGYAGQPETRLALKLAPLVFVRPGELRHAEWSEIDLDAGTWIIPVAKMKMKRRKGGLRDPHFVPLSRQAVEIIRQLEPLTGKGQYLFPSARSFKRPMSENTLNAALRRLGYDNEEMTAHGFRSMASTRLNESGKWSGDAIELQLAHEDSDQTRKSYMAKARFREERVKMMQWWADYLDTLHDGGAEVVPLTKESDHGR